MSDFGSNFDWKKIDSTHDDVRHQPFKWKLVETDEDYRFRADTQAIFNEMVNKMMAIEDEIHMAAVITVLRMRGYTVTKNEEE
jgi:hypothetical protein